MSGSPSSFVVGHACVIPQLQLLKKNPKERLGCKSARQGAKELKSHSFFKRIDFKRLEAGVVQPSFVPDVCQICIFSSQLVTHRAFGYIFP